MTLRGTDPQSGITQVYWFARRQNLSRGFFFARKRPQTLNPPQNVLFMVVLFSDGRAATGFSVSEQVMTSQLFV